MTGKVQGMFWVAGVPQVLPKTAWAVLATLVNVTLLTGYFVKRDVPIELGSACLANCTNSVDSNVVAALLVVRDRSGWMDAKKKARFLTIGPPIVPARLL